MRDGTLMNGTPIEFSRLARTQESSPPSVGSPNPPSILSLFRPGDRTHTKANSAHPSRAPSATSLELGRGPLFRRHGVSNAGVNLCVQNQDVLWEQFCLCCPASFEWPDRRRTGKLRIVP